MMRYLELKGISPVYVDDSDRWMTSYHTTHPKERKNYNDGYISEYEIARDDPALVTTVNELGDDVNGQCSELVVTEIPDGVDWEIHDYDGSEHVMEKHRTW